MRILVIAAFVCIVFGGSASAQTGNADLMAPIQKFMDTFNAGDMAGAAATHAAGADLAIMDEVAPHLWQGAKAFQAWSTDLDNDAKKNGITEPKVTISPATRVERNGDRAYVIVPAVYTFKQKGAAMRESAQMTFVLGKGANGWLIHGWTWTGSKAKAAAAGPVK